MAEGIKTIAILGGTGALGAGLAFRLAKAGFHIVIGSREAARAEEACATLRADVPDGIFAGAALVEAAAQCDLAILTIPYAHHGAVLEAVKSALTDKILVDATVPLNPPKVMTACLPAEGSAAQQAQAILGEQVTVVSALQNVGARHLRQDHGEIDCDVLVCGNNKDARSKVIQLLADCGLRGLHAGQLANSAAAEAMTSLLIFMNKTYGSDRAGLRITGL